jgi:hypothetical protein
MQDTDYGVTDHSFSVCLRRDFKRKTPSTIGILSQQGRQQQNEHFHGRHIRNRRYDINSRTPPTTIEPHNGMKVEK